MTDIVGSTEHAAELGDRGWRDLVQMHHGVVRAALRRYRGREVDTAGDGFFCVFDAPAAAVECALEICRGVRELGIDVRAGLHVGEVEQIAGKVGGIAVPIASRIMATAGPGEVVVSATVRDLATGAGLRFEDRGIQKLKGVPGEWRTFMVARHGDLKATAATAAGRVATPADAEIQPSSRRAAAVRRTQSRPIWVRRRRLSAAVIAVLVAAVASTGLLAWSPWRAPALAAVGEDSVGLIDPVRNEVVGQIKVGGQPSGIAHGEGSVWIANSGTDTVSRIDLASRAVIDTIEVQRAPASITVGNGSVWVSNSGSRSVSRIDAASGRVVDTIEVGNAPGAIAYGAGAVWVANSADGTVTRIDGTTGEAGRLIPVGPAPSAIAVDDAGVWVASRESAVVVRLDPLTGVTKAAPIGVGSRPEAMALAGGSVWVANAGDDSVTRLDTATDRVTATVDVGGSPVGLIAADDAVWVAVQEGFVRRIDPRAPNAEGLLIPTTAAPGSVALVDGSPWFVTRAATASHRGGTIRVVGQGGLSVDPAAFPTPALRSLYADGLVGYRREGGIKGSILVPNLAIAIPRPSDGGRTYTFTLRSGIEYSDGTPVRPEDFRTGIERLFQVEDPGFGVPGAVSYTAIEGAGACGDGPVRRCDLSAGIVTDATANTVTFHLSEPDPDFLAKLALEHAMPVPAGSMPMNSLATGPFPSTGPYMIESSSADEIHLTRNPNFHSWDPDVRPDGFADQIIWMLGLDPLDQVQMVQEGEADYMLDYIPAESFQTLRTQYATQLHLATEGTTFVFMNTQLAPFDNPDVRRAVTLAVDRSHAADLRGGTPAASVTCQVLPPNFPGYEPYCPWTADPDLGERWKGPDLATAKGLVAASGTAGMEITVGPFIPRLTELGAYVTTLLDELGYVATQETVADQEQVFQAIFVDKRVAIGGFEYRHDFLGPGTFLAGFTCDDSDSLSNYCDPEFDALVAEARILQATDPIQSASKWSAIDRQVVDLALWAPLVNEGSDFVSARLGNYQFHPQWTILLDQAWVQ